MAEFFNLEASESEGEGEEDVVVADQLVKEKQKDGGNSEEEEDDEEEGEQLVQDLIDDAPIDEDGESDDEPGVSSGKRKKSYLPDNLDDDDFDLIEENIGVKLQRKKKYKRLRFDEDSDDEVTLNQGDDRDAIANQLFDDDEVDRRDPTRDETTALVQYDSDESDYSDSDDFIVDDQDQPLNDGRRKRKSHFSDATIQSAQDIFGLDVDYEGLIGGDGDHDDEDEEGGTRQKKKTVSDMYEPYEFERAGLTKEDDKIRSTDVPERLQLRAVPITEPANDDEIEEEAEWIYRKAFTNLAAANQLIPSASGTATANAQTEETSWGDDWDKRTTVSNVTTFTFHAPPQTICGEDDDDDEDAPAVPKRSLEEVKEEMLYKIQKILWAIRNEKLDVPFIAYFRKEYAFGCFSCDDLWTIFRLDGQYCQLMKKKYRLTELFKNMLEHQVELIKGDDQVPASVRLITDEDIDRIQLCNSAEGLRDMYELFRLYYSAELPAMRKRKEQEQATAAETSSQDPELEDSTTAKKPVMRRKKGAGIYETGKRWGVDAFVKKFGLSAERFAENLKDRYLRHEIDQCSTEPADAAKEMFPQRLKVPDVLKAAKAMMAIQISRDPVVRECVRKVFFERATLSCSPTKKGRLQIDSAHPCFSMRYLKDKPVKRLIGDEFMRLALAEEDGLLDLSLGNDIEGAGDLTYVEEVKQFFIKDEYSRTVEEWNALRGDCIEYAFENLLYPLMRKELRAKLSEDAKEHVLKLCSDKLSNYLKIAPFMVNIPDSYEEEWGTAKGIRVLAIAYVPDDEQAAFACLVGPGGEFSDHLKLPNIIKNSKSANPTEREEKETDLLAVKKFIELTKPHVIVIGGESLEAVKIKADIEAVLDELVTEGDFLKVRVEIIDNDPAKVYANSTKATNDFRDHPPLLRQALSLGRRMQDPLIELAQLFTIDEDILCMRFHPLQDHVPKGELLERLEHVFVNQTNEVGVDLNLAMEHPHRASVIQFLSGLGLRKATAIMKGLKQDGKRLENREQLYADGYVDKIVYYNCVGFIKIDTDAFGDSTETFVEVLDGLRIHPHSYEWARLMASRACDIEGLDAVFEALDHPEKLHTLKLEAFADNLETIGHKNKIETLRDIVKEFEAKFKDPRVPFNSPTTEELFYMLTKETPQTLYAGKLTTATVAGFACKKPTASQLELATPEKNPFRLGFWQCSFCGRNDFPNLEQSWAHFDSGNCPGEKCGVHVKFENGMFGFIPNAKLSDSHVANPEERVQRGQTIHCRIIKIDMDRISVECTSRTSDLLDSNGEWKPEKDDFYDQGKEDLDTKKEEEVPKNKPRPTYSSRLVVHPLFKNVPFEEAERLLESMEQGDVIIRPSSKGPGHFSVSWKVADKVYQHIPVREEHTDQGSTFGGKQVYWIGNEEYEDMDEIIVRCVNMMANYARAIVDYKYFVNNLDGTWQKANEYLLEATKRDSSRNHYILQASREFPGKFLLSYLAPPRKPAHEFITLSPYGMRYRLKDFDSLDALLTWFKKYYRMPPPYIPGISYVG